MTFQAKMISRSLIIKTISLTLILLQAGIFFCANTRPLYWTNDEILWQGAFWSESQTEDHTLYTGFRKQDLMKPFNVYHADGTFRTRHVSYFLEMMSFKFWQWFGKVFIRNHTLIFLHMLNALLAGFLVFRMTRSSRSGLITCLLMLNSGAALATLLYPFRNAKILVMTFFLLAWLVLTPKGKTDRPLSWPRLCGFLGLMLLAFLTDEIAFFFFPILFLFLIHQRGWKGVFNVRMMCGTLITLLVFGLCAFGAYHLSVHVIDADAHTGEQMHYLQSLGKYLTNPVILKDVGRAFFFYFLRRNYGYWDTTPLGMLSFFATLTLILLILKYRPHRGHWKVAGIILGLITVKAFAFPHNAGYHRVFMPEGTVFPSLFFFSYYYIYAEALLFTLGLGLLLDHAIRSDKRFVGLLALIAVISASNAFHLKDGPQDALAFMRFDKDHPENPQGMVKKVVAVEKVLDSSWARPVYLSFPVGKTDILLAKRDDPFTNLYARMIPLRYLHSLEQGKAFTSYQNIQYPFSFFDDNEIRQARSFYDVVTQKEYDITELKNARPDSAFRPVIATPQSVGSNTKIASPRPIDHIVFFIKGRSGFRVQVNDHIWEGQQVYGKAYQIFQFDEPPGRAKNLPALVRVAVLPVDDNTRSALVGPFIIYQQK
jgi:hypothetical protein